MKEIRAIIQPHKVEKVVESLHALDQFPGFTLSNATGQGHGRGPGGEYQPTASEIFLRRQAVLEVICSDEMASRIVEVIRKEAHTGHTGDGLVTVRALENVVHIRTGMSNP